MTASSSSSVFHVGIDGVHNAEMGFGGGAGIMWNHTNNEFLLGIIFYLQAKDPVDIQIKAATHALDQGDMMGFDKLIIETESSAVCEMLNSSDR